MPEGPNTKNEDTLENGSPIEGFVAARPAAVLVRLPFCHVVQALVEFAPEFLLVKSRGVL